MATPAQIVRALLVGAGLVKMPGVNLVPGNAPLPPIPPAPVDAYCYVGEYPSGDDRMVCLRDGAGVSGGREMRGGKRHQFAGVQLLVRDLEYLSAHALALSVATYLDTIAGVTVTLPEDGSEHYVQAVTRGGIISLGEEQGTRRNLFSVNARVSFQDPQPTAN